MTPGVTNLPAASMTVAPSGAAMSAPPSAEIFPSLMTSVPFSTFSPAPVRIVAPRMTVTPEA